MTGEIVLDKQSEKMASEKEQGYLGILEEKIAGLLLKYQELKKENEELTAGLEQEKEKNIQLEKKMEFFSNDREKVKTRVDQLLQRLKGIDM
jgi:chromosome segregation ATPase